MGRREAVFSCLESGVPLAKTFSRSICRYPTRSITSLASSARKASAPARNRITTTFSPRSPNGCGRRISVILRIFGYASRMAAGGVSEYPQDNRDQHENPSRLHPVSAVRAEEQARREFIALYGKRPDPVFEGVL